MKTDSKLFGTDGIRGKAGHFPVQPEIILKVGQALGFLLMRQKKSSNPPMVLIGKDTRISGYMLEQALASGLNSMGVWVQLTGPLPTPGIGFLARNMRASAGVVISASHNPYYDNGIKIFNADGFKISKKMEEEIESLVFSESLNKSSAVSDQIGRSRRIDDAIGRYIVHVKNSFPLKKCTLEGMRIVLDCANGAGYKLAPIIFKELGAEVISIHSEPNGFNINKNAGALFPENMQKMVKEHKALAGLSLDGDGDRVVMADETGELLDGDNMLGICALDRKERGLLKGSKAAGTYMCNKGLEVLLAKNGIELVRTEVGDRNVVEKMKTENIVLGGEPSGHIIFLEQNTTADGLAAGLNVLAVMCLKNKKLSELRKLLVKVPQVQLSVPFNGAFNKEDLFRLPGYKDLTKKIYDKLGAEGRLYVRFSGTEPVIRILLEGRDALLIKKLTGELNNFLHKKLL